MPRSRRFRTLINTSVSIYQLYSFHLSHVLHPPKKKKKPKSFKPCKFILHNHNLFDCKSIHSILFVKLIVWSDVNSFEVCRQLYLILYRQCVKRFNVYKCNRYQHHIVTCFTVLIIRLKKKTEKEE